VRVAESRGRVQRRHTWKRQPVASASPTTCPTYRSLLGATARTGASSSIITADSNHKGVQTPGAKTKLAFGGRRTRHGLRSMPASRSSHLTCADALHVRAGRLRTARKPARHAATVVTITTALPPCGPQPHAAHPSNTARRAAHLEVERLAIVSKREHLRVAKQLHRRSDCREHSASNISPHVNSLSPTLIPANPPPPLSDLAVSSQAKMI